MSELFDPFVDADGTRWYDLGAASRKIGYAAKAPALRRWVERGETTFGLPIESKLVPVVTTTRYTEGCSYKPRWPRSHRPVISETTVEALNAVFHKVSLDKRRRGKYSPDELARLQSAVRRIASPPLREFHP